jgi:hypothetical protein
MQMSGIEADAKEAGWGGAQRIMPEAAETVQEIFRVAIIARDL